MANAAGTNWAANLAYSAARLHTPSSVDEVRRIVAAASSIRALGSRHSFNSIADGTEELMSTAALTGPVRIDREAMVATVGAGTRYGELAVELQSAGFALANLASLPHISIGGAIATGTHGSGDRNTSLAAAVVGLEFVTAGGELARYDAGDPNFEGMVVNLGALGVVTEVTLAIEPTFEVAQSVFENLSWNAVSENFDALTGSAYSVSMFTSWQNLDVFDMAWLKSRVGSDATPTLFGALPAQGERHPIPNLPAVGCTPQLGIAGPWFDRLPHFRLNFTPSNGVELQSEYVVPRRFAVEALAALRFLSAEIAPLLQVCEIRTVAADDLWLSSSYGTDVMGMHFTWKQDQPAVEALLPALEAVLEPFSARPHWGKLFTTDPERLAGLYPKIGDFCRLVRDLDPEGVFANPFLDLNVTGAAASRR
ncbi:D-arabinono-1,4-lactone oxidase [Arthrobacter sp. H5]|uniref:D-arabinono-1,4-lactone oxidase n=1 Tax=Arthrobacter sp. H5 TaxID=1267973 RepID=UPI0004ACA5DA|nr:D-arabinono-1,4-lactone oxidase [Arthrobacter sp. H5]